MMIKRKKTRSVKVGNVKVGGDAPISIQSMTKVETRDVARVVSQIRRLEACSCEIIRVAIKNNEDAEAVSAIRRKIKIPLVCDIHFDHRLALKCIKNGADKIRLNPGNIRKREDIAAVVKAAKRAHIPIRIGVNSGSVLTEGAEHVTRNALVDSALSYIKLFEAMDFRDIIVSLKASGVETTVNAYRRMSKLCDYPLHLGVTASGSYDGGVVKSAVGIGALLLDGIGDTIRVSLTAEPEEEVIAAKRILSAVGLRHFGPDIISCPTCGRCQVDLGSIVKELDHKLSAIRPSAGSGLSRAFVEGRYPLNAKRPVTIALMGCEVNGPGEAREADIGIAAGKKSGALFIKGKIVKRIKEKDFISEIIKFLK